MYVCVMYACVHVRVRARALKVYAAGHSIYIRDMIDRSIHSPGTLLSDIYTQFTYYFFHDYNTWSLIRHEQSF